MIQTVVLAVEHAGMGRKSRRTQATRESVSPSDATTATRRLFAEALAHHQAQDLTTAEQIYRKLLVNAPFHAESLHLLGVVAAQSGRYDEAAELIAEALRHAPELAEAHNNLGIVLAELGQPEQAIVAYGNALVLKSDYAEAYNNLAVCFRKLGFQDKALDAYAKALALKPDYAEAHNNLGVVLRDLGRHDEALAATDAALSLNPHYADAHNNRAVTLNDLGRKEEAVAAYRAALTAQPDYAQAWHNLGITLQALGRHDEAMACYDRAAHSAKPGFESPLVHKAILLMENGQASEALETLDRALSLNPASAHAWYIRRELKIFSAGDPDIAAMTAVLNAADIRRLDPDARIHLEFALGKAWMDVGDVDRAFTHFNEGNRLKRSTFDYHDDAAARHIAGIVQSFTPDLIDRFSGAGDPSDVPIFIVGMPRSGTTLIEQILASHPEIHGAGELPLLEEEIAYLSAQSGASYPGFLSSLSPGDLTDAARRYIERLTELAPGRRRIVDKMLINFNFAGLIHLMLPNARIIHCRRDPIDTCLSCYTKIFSGNQNCTYDLAELGSYYRHYETLMAHWRDLLPPERFIEVQYEDVVNDLEGEARRLIAFCGLDWDPVCLAFHKTRRQVRTASANQVRQPLYRGSVGRWKAYEQHLGPLLAALQITHNQS